MLFPGDILECLSAMSMPLADLIFLAFALSVDAFVVAFSYGLLIKQKRLSNGIKLSLSTGAGQFLMPVLGFLLTGSVHRYIAAWDHWLGFAVFTFLGVNVLREGWNHRNEEEDVKYSCGRDYLIIAERGGRGPVRFSTYYDAGRTFLSSFAAYFSTHGHRAF